MLLEAMGQLQPAHTVVAPANQQVMEAVSLEDSPLHVLAREVIHGVGEELAVGSQDPQRQAELIEHVRVVQAVIAGSSPENIALLAKQTKIAQQDESPIIRRVGIAMAAIGVLTVIAGCLIIAASLAAASTGILAVIGAPGVGVGAKLVTWGLFTTAAGVGVVVSEPRPVVHTL